MKKFERNWISIHVALMVSLLLLCAPAFAQVRYEIKMGAHIGGYWGSAAVTDDYAFVCQGTMLSTIDLTTPSLTKVNSYMLMAEPTNMVYADNKLFLTAGQSDSSFQIFDVEDPLNPVLLGTADINLGWGSGLAVSENFACLTSRTELHLIDIANPALPVVAATVTLDARDICLSGETLFAVTEGHLVIYDVSTLAAPKEISRTPLKDGSVVSIHNNHLFVGITDYGGARFGLQIVDVSDKNNPQLKGFLATRAEGEEQDDLDPKSIVSNGPIAYVGCKNAWLIIVDVSNVDAPVKESEIRLASGSFPSITSLNISGSYLYATTGACAAGFVRVDVAESDNPAIADQMVEPWDIQSLFSRRDTLYVSSIERLWIYRVNDPDHPQLLGSDDRWGEMVHIAAAGSYLYGIRNDSLYVLTVSDPATIQLAGSYQSSKGDLRRINVRDQKAFLLNSDKNQPHVIVVDVSNTANPQEITSYLLSGEARALHAPTGDSLIYVAYSGGPLNNGFVILDTQKSTNPQVVGGNEVRGVPSTIWVSDSLLFVGSNADNDSCYLQSFNISTPAQPDLFNAVSKAGEIWDVKARLPQLMTSLPSGSLYLLNGLKYCQRGYYYVPSSLFFTFFWTGGGFPSGMATMAGWGDTPTLRASASWGIFFLWLYYWLAVQQLFIYPQDATVPQGDQVKFGTNAFDQRGNDTKGEYKWTATGGEMDTLTGEYTATETGTFTITVTDTLTGKSSSTTVTVTLATVVKASAGEITEYRLEQNYPNPFNPETTISYSIREAAQVRLSLINIRGRTVMTLIDQYQSPGAYQYRFTAADLPSGIYFYRLQANAFGQVRKMVIIE
ncbi:T9SS type A sorting domain-containing protein [candidate division KSB1 bacterium]|nr:T9SS type A sorting domain-containing protein [candidate division KSB1 bacterium]